MHFFEKNHCELRYLRYTKTQKLLSNERVAYVWISTIVRNVYKQRLRHLRLAKVFKLSIVSWGGNFYFGCFWLLDLYYPCFSEQHTTNFDIH